ncbi:hypothetical protein I79_006539 [Cricetulus griseus]|uniref:Uncharacterized protein n=1 Tax=Cricetulus griseus TaxID=10029 RepID=G3H841_CRIGR|nr:hypothetical protein I79_006539 [Cricetulus griseus]
MPLQVVLVLLWAALAVGSPVAEPQESLTFLLLLLQNWTVQRTSPPEELAAAVHTLQ